jgi:hypothetical protein
MNRVLVVLLAVTCLFGALARPTRSQGSEQGFPTTSVRTNLVDRWVTNTAEIKLQVNRFVTEYHTNYVTRVETNYVNLFSTNLLTAYVTNRIQATKTNYVDVFYTNTIALTVTNMLFRDSYHTNFVQSYQTNLKTLTLTNWTTIVALKTNWITQPLTNVVQIDLPSEAPQASAPLAKAPAPGNSELLAIQATRTARLNFNNQVEVHLTVSWAQTPSAPVQVQQWRIERQDGSILCFGQEPDFKRTLPQGTYKVVVKAQRDPKGPLLAALGTLTVSSREVLLEQRPARSNSSI